MVEQFFASLSKRQTMLLLTAVTFGGNDGDALEHLPDEEKEILQHRAKGLLEIPRDKRIPLLVQEIKRLITARRKQLGSADPGRLAQALAQERSALIEVVLKALPAPLAEAVRQDLPPRAPVKLKREVRPDVLSIIRWKLEDALKQGSAQVGLFKFSDLLTLQQRELLTICDRMGARALATAFAGLSEEEAGKLFVALPPDQRSLAQRACEAGKTRKLSEGDSRTVLSMYDALENPSAGMRSAGAQRLARACVAQGQDFAIKLIDRHTGELAKLLTKWVKEERHRPIRADGGRADIVEQMERLAQRGVIDRPMRLPPPPALPRAQSGGVLAPPPQRKSVQMVPVGNSVPRAPERGPTGERPMERPPGADRPSMVERPVIGDRPVMVDRSPMGPRAPMGGRAPGHERGPVPERPRSSLRRTGPRPRRDFMAERNARAAGAASARLPDNSGPIDPRVRAVSDPSAVPSQARVLRDGKPMPKGEGGSVRKAMTSPALQEIPKRREKPGSPRVITGFHRPSKVVKGSKPGSDP